MSKLSLPRVPSMPAVSRFTAAMRVSALFSALVLAGCAVGPDYQAPAMPLSAAYRAAVPLAAEKADWWTDFHDATLDALVAQALANNTDIAVAAARVEQARAASQGAVSALLPSANANASVERDRQSLDAPLGAVGNALGLPRSYTLYQAGVQASWELDVFGGLRRRLEASNAAYAGTRAEAAAVRLSVAAEVADAYLQLRGLQARLDIATRQLNTERKLAELVRLRRVQGLASDRELNRVVGEREGLEAALPPLRAAVVAVQNRIDVLLGRQAGTGAPALSAQAAIPQAPDPAGSVEPAMLLRRRPDIGAAEYRLASANARIGAALAEYYPQVSLGGLLGVASVGTGTLWDDSAVQAGGLLGIRWRLFDFGRVDAEVAAARGREAEALAQYRGAVLRATEEVETAFTRLAEGRKEVEAGERAVRALAVSRDQARQAYQGGVLALTDVLDADRALLDASNRLAAARAQTARASVAAVRALGGGWQEERS